MFVDPADRYCNGSVRKVSSSHEPDMRLVSSFIMSSIDISSCVITEDVALLANVCSYVLSVVAMFIPMPPFHLCSKIMNV